MALNPVQRDEKVKKGGGLFGSILGGITGGAAAALAVPTAGASLAAIPAAMSAGSTIGGVAGEAIDPSKVGGGKVVGMSALAKDPEVQMMQLDDTRKLIAQSPDLFPEPKQYIEHLERAKQSIAERMKLG